MKRRLVVVALIVLPMIWLFDVRHPPSTPIDYANATWVASYFGEYLREHWAFPVVLNDVHNAGIPSPGYYGYLLQPSAGVLSAFVGGDLAIRAILFGSFAFQQIQVYRAVVHITGRREFGIAALALVACEIYPMSELYQAGRVAEFVARAWLLSAACLWLQCLSDGKLVRGRLLLLGLSLAIVFGTHPVHFVYGAGLTLVAMVLTFVAARDRLAFLRDAVVVGAAVLVVIAPWLYLLRFYAPTIVSVEIPVYANFDKWYVRLLPFPYSPPQGFGPVDAQISIPLLLVALALGFGLFAALRNGDRTGRLEAIGAVVALLVAAELFAVSVTWRAAAPLKVLFWTVQWVHRFVGFIDLLLFVAVCLLLLAYRRRGLEISKAGIGIGYVALAVAAISFGAKLVESFPVPVPLEPGMTLLSDRAALITRSDTLLANDYASKRGFADELPAGVSANVLALFPIGTGRSFGVPSPAVVGPVSGHVTAALTDAIAHPWNRLAVNGRLVPLLQTYAVDAPLGGTPSQMTYGGVSQVFEGVLVTKPKTTIELRTVPDPVWLWLRAVSLSVFALWIALAVALAITKRASDN